MSNQSKSNRRPVKCQFWANLQPILANPCQSMPIWCQSWANRRPILSQSVPIHANRMLILRQSKANPEPLRCQSEANFLFRQYFFNLPIWSNPIPSDPIQSNLVPIGGHISFYKKYVHLSICQCEQILANPCKSDTISANLIQVVRFGANQTPIFRCDTYYPICQSLPIRANPLPIQCKSSANRGPYFLL